MCFFSNKKLISLEKENNRLNDELLAAKKEVLKLTQEKSQLLDSCFDIITDAFPNPDERTKWLNELGRYKKEENLIRKQPQKFIYILVIDEDDKQIFFDNYRDIAKDLNITVDSCSFIKNDMGDIHFKVVIIATKDSDVNTFWDMIEQILDNSIDYTRY